MNSLQRWMMGLCAAFVILLGVSGLIWLQETFAPPAPVSSAPAPEPEVPPVIVPVPVPPPEPVVIVAFPQEKTVNAGSGQAPDGSSPGQVLKPEELAS